MVVMNGLISIILPIYNVEKYIRHCLECIICQSYKNLQIICIIDGSSDNSENICKEFAKKDSRFEIIMQKNCGCAVARNNALKYVKGSYICFIDPDDYVNKTYIESLYKAITINASDIALAKMIRIKGKSKKIRTHFNSEKKYSTHSEIFAVAECPPDYGVVNKMYRTELIKQNNILFETNCLWCDDVRFCVEAFLAAKSIVTVPDAIYYYIKRVGSISHSKVSYQKQLQRFRIRSAAVKNIIAHNVHIPPKELFVTKLVYSFFSVPLFSIRKNIKNNRIIVLLFGILPILKKEEND